MTLTILHIIDTTGPGGAETIFTQLAADSKKRGFRSLALIRGPGWVQAELERLGIETIVRDCKGSLNVGFLKFLIQLLMREKVDIVQSHLLGSNVYASLAGFFTLTPVISTFHGFVDISAKEKFSALKFLSIRLGSKKVIAVTDQIKQMLNSNRWLNPKKITTIANGVDTDLFSVKKNYTAIDSNAFRIGCLGNVRRAKNYPLALAVLKALREGGWNVELHIAGDDTNALAAECKSLATQLDLSEHVVWHGFISDACSYLHSLDVFLLSSTSEGHPLALTQAMSCGLPIVVTPCGVEHIIHHSVNGLVCASMEPQVVADNLKQLLESADLRKELGSNGALSARRLYSLNATMLAYQKEYYLNLRSPFYRPETYLKDKFGGRRGFLRSIVDYFNLNLLGKNKKYMSFPANVERVVFVCKGNICRSALAEWAFRKHTQFPAASFGVDTTSGCPANPRIARMAALFDIDLLEHKTTAKSNFVPAKNDLYVCVEPAHAAVIEQTMPGQPIFYLGALLDNPCTYLHDPHTTSDNFALRSVVTIITAVERLALLANTRIEGSKPNV